MKFKFIWEDKRWAALNRQGSLRQRFLESFYQCDEPKKLQSRFIYEHVQEFFDLLEKRYMHKILDDISYILDQKWALRICEEDSFHGHVSGKSKTVIRDLDTLLSASNICFLYHTFEKQSSIPQAINRNVLSFPDAVPRVVHPDCKFGEFPGYGVSSTKLGLMEYARFYFEANPKGPYKLRRRKIKLRRVKMDLWGMFP
jgi:hypothetical protein